MENEPILSQTTRPLPFSRPNRMLLFLPWRSCISFGFCFGTVGRNKPAALKELADIELFVVKVDPFLSVEMRVPASLLQSSPQLH